MLCLWAAVLWTVPEVYARQDAPLVLPRLSGPVLLDGCPDEPAWDEIEPLPLVGYVPVAGAPPSERTEIRIAYDDRYLYGSIRAYDASGNVRANSLYRDRTSGDDLFVILLDTFDDNRSAITFTMSPTGARRDASVSNDGAGPGALNPDFNLFWDLETVITEEGWFAEVRIPFSSLRFQDDQGRVQMGLIVQRVISRRNERISFPPLPADTDRAFLKPSLARKVTMEGVYSSRPLYVAPYVLGGRSRSMIPDVHAFRSQNDLQHEFGLDLKYGLANDLTLDVTVNTDFAQAEADDQQVNFTRFSLFYPEKRAFFQERSGLFEFRTGGESRLFHSRRIGLTDEGNPVRLLGGARLVGRIGAWDVGFLDLQTAKSDGLPAENFGVARMRRRVFNPYSYAGGLFTSRIGRNGSYNVAYGLDGVFRLFGDDYLSVQWAQTFDSTFPSSGLQSGRGTASIERRRRRGFGYQSALTWSGPDYLPGVGFTQRNDFTQAAQTLSYSWVPGAEAPMIWHTLQVEGTVFARNTDGKVETFEAGPAWTLALKSGDEAAVAFTVFYDDLLLPFALSPDAHVPAGGYTFYSAAASYEMHTGRLLRTDLMLESGSFYDGSRTAVTLAPAWNVSRHLELGGTYLYNRTRFPDRNEQFDAHIARLRIGTALNTRVSTNAFLQFNSARSAVSANVRFRYNFREGVDLWIVYNEGLNTDLYRVSPRLPRSDTRSLLVKYTHTFVL